MNKNLKAIDFGTAGIRGKVGSGIDHLGHAHVQRVAHGYAKYLSDKYSNLNKITVIVGRDNRRFSCKYSRVITEILASYPRFEIILSKKITPTPFVSFLITQNKAQAGVNITASHNPKEYNGIKLYNEHGSQCLPDEIAKIQSYFEDWDKYSDKYITQGCWPRFKNVRNTHANEWNSYIEAVSKVGGEIKVNGDKVKIAYSPLHGTGSTLAEEVFAKIGWKSNVDVFFEDAQFIQDRNFSTCSYPNPERNEVYDAVKHIAEKNNAEIVLVTDPDSDRVGLEVLHNGTWVHFNGNETATLILDYLIKTAQNKDFSGKYLVSSFVSSNLPELIAKKHGLDIKIVPTGFKWIGHCIVENKDSFFYGFEESYGSLIDPAIAKDKDAIQSIVIITKMTQHYKNKGLNLVQVLEQIYAEYGHVVSETIDINTDENTDLSVIQHKFKNLNIADKVINDYNNADGIMRTNMIKISFKDKPDWIAFRPSGTEPKIKFYIFAYGSNYSQAQKKLVLYKQIITELVS
ncbi:phosphomannomutase [Mycoplasmopsis californica]|uniref:Phosphomannomutase n=1 Tax=Mycoplasmopsis californica TaxID=2113 RepID=A0A059XLD0_9BACT|nr:phospho-sugar mutase [Mycoplasmopsis californica]AIA29304.1 phosphomannomutase [Mycoplasmopsis californica]